MSLHSVNELFALSPACDWALPHFNMLNAEVLKAVIQAAEQENSPVILAMGPTSIGHMGLRPFSALIRSMAEESSVPMALHLDHAKDMALIRQALDYGFTSVMFDGSSLPYEENLRLTGEVATMAHDRGASAEGEIGIVPVGAQALAGTVYTDPEQAVDFAGQSHVDLLAVSVGSSHRMRSQDATLDIPLIRSLSSAAGVPLVLHGGSGVVDADIARAVACGLRKINISTALKQAFMDGLRRGVTQDASMDPLPALQSAMHSACEFAVQRIRLCNASGKARTV